MQYKKDKTNDSRNWFLVGIIVFLNGIVFREWASFLIVIGLVLIVIGFVRHAQLKNKEQRQQKQEREEKEGGE